LSSLLGSGALGHVKERMMAEQKSPAELLAEASSEDTRSFIRRVKRATQRKYTSEEKVRVIVEGFRGEIGISASCRREGIHPTVYYAWLKDFMEAGKGASPGGQRPRCHLAENVAQLRDALVS
jgi:transposase